jgi:hypothetical protein
MADIADVLGEHVQHDPDLTVFFSQCIAISGAHGTKLDTVDSIRPKARRVMSSARSAQMAK